MSNLISFDFQNSSIRVINKQGEPWFVANDVCNTLEIANARDAISSLDDDEKDVVLTDTLGGKQKLNIINESGLYVLILRSRKAIQKGTVQHKFRKWVTAEVLPQIRKTGHYRQTTASDRTPLRQAVSLLVGKRGIGYDVAYSLVHQYMGVSHIDQIPQEDLPKAVAYVHHLALARNESLTQAVQNLAWHTLFIYSWYKAIEPHFRALSPKLSYEIHDHIIYARGFAGSIQKQIGLGGWDDRMHLLESKQWVIS